MPRCLGLRQILLLALVAASVSLAAAQNGESAPPPGDRGAGARERANGQAQGQAHAWVLDPLPATEIDPDAYILGPGDSLAVYVTMPEPVAVQETTVAAGGEVFVGEPVGSVQAAGRTLTELRELVQERFEYYYVAPRASVQLVSTRYFEIVVTGGVEFPGAYSVPAGTRFMRLMQAAGGVRPTGTQRDVLIRRVDGSTVHIDYLKRLLGLVDEIDPELAEGDAVHVAPIGETVELTGTVREEGAYEIAPGETLQDVVDLAGGLNGRADLGAMIWKRHQEGAVSIVQGALDSPVQGGDDIEIPEVTRKTIGVLVTGAVKKPDEPVEYVEGLTVVDALRIVGVKPDADLARVLLERSEEGGRRLYWLDVLGDAGPDPKAADNRVLKQGDALEVRTFDQNADEIQLVGPFEGLGCAEAPPSSLGVSVYYRLRENDTLTSVLRATGGLRAAGNPAKVRLERQGEDGGVVKTDYSLLAIDEGKAEDPRLVKGDRLTAFTLEEHRPFVQVSGEFFASGVLPPVTSDRGSAMGAPLRQGSRVIGEGETLTQLCDDLRFTSVADKRHIRIRRYDQGAYVSFEADYLAIKEGKAKDVVLQAGDQIYVPNIEWRLPVVTIVGEFRGIGKFSQPAADEGPTARADKRANVPFVEGATLRELLIDQGGLSPHADPSAAYLVRRATADEAERRVAIDLEAMIFRGDDSQNLELVDGDVIVIPRRQGSVYVIGTWAQQGAFEYFEGSHVADYVAKAGTLDVDGGGQRTKARCVLARYVADEERREVYVFDWRKALEGDPEHNLEVRPGDAILSESVSLSGWRDIVELLPGISIARSLIDLIF